METYTRHERESREIAVWRRDQLVRVGFSLPLAVVLADDQAYDLHSLVELVERGCPPDLAARILAPLQEASAA